MTEVNLGPCEGQAVPVWYKTPSVLITASLVGDWGKKGKMEKIHCHVRNRYFVTVNVMKIVAFSNYDFNLGPT